MAEPPPGYVERVHSVTDLARRGELAAAETELLAMHRDFSFDDRAQRSILNMLASVYARGGRMFESLVLSRFLARVARAKGETRSEFNALNATCTALYGLYIQAERRDILARLDELFPEFEHFAEFEVNLAYCHLGQALDDGDLDAAREHIARMRRATQAQDEQSRQLIACITLANEAIVELRSDRPDRALELLDDLDRRGVAHEHHQPELRVLRVRTQVARGDRDQARVDARHAAAVLAAASPVALSESVLYGTQLAQLLETDLEDPMLALQVYDVAATAVVRRITQLDTCLREQANLPVGSRDTSELKSYRVTFRQGQRKLLDRVGALLQDEGAEDARAVFERAKREGLVGICAWCESIRTGSDWMPFGHFLPRDGSYEITATICPPCREKYRLDKV